MWVLFVGLALLISQASRINGWERKSQLEVTETLDSAYGPDHGFRRYKRGFENNGYRYHHQGQQWAGPSFENDDFLQDDVAFTGPSNNGLGRNHRRPRRQTWDDTMAPAINGNGRLGNRSGSQAVVSIEDITTSQRSASDVDTSGREGKKGDAGFDPLFLDPTSNDF